MLLIADARAVDPGMVSTIQQDAKKIGITFTVRTINGAYPTIQTPSKNVPIAERPGWGKDYADALTFFSAAVRRSHDHPERQHELLARRDHAGAVQDPQGHRQLHTTCRASTAQLDKCSVLIGPARARLLREPRQEPDDEGRAVGAVAVGEVVTRITSTNVTQYQFDQFSTTPAWSEISVKG